MGWGGGKEGKECGGIQILGVGKGSKGEREGEMWSGMKRKGGNMDKVASGLEGEFNGGRED